MRIRFIHPAIGQATTWIPRDRDVVVGRPGVDADIELTWDSRISRRQACLWQADGALWFLDLDSHNGSWVGRDRLRGPVKLEIGTSILLGETVLQRISSEAPRALKLEYDAPRALVPDLSAIIEPPPARVEPDTMDLSGMTSDVTTTLRALTPPTAIPSQENEDGLRFEGAAHVAGKVNRTELLQLWREGLRRDGLYVNAATPPPPGTNVSIELQTPGGPLSLKGRVVSVLSPEQANSAGMSPGAGIDVRWSRGQRDALEAYLQFDRKRPTGDRDEGPGANRVQEILEIARTLIRAYEADSFYAALGLLPSARRDAVSDRNDELLASIESAYRQASPPQQARLQTARAALARMRRVLLNDDARLEHDFRMGFIDAERRLGAVEAGRVDIQTLRQSFNRVQPTAVAEAARLTREAFASNQAGEQRTALHLAQRAYHLNPFFVELKDIITGWQKALEGAQPDPRAPGPRWRPQPGSEALKDR